MNSYIVCIGNELLIGKTINTNAAWIGKQIAEVGCDIISNIVVPDEEIAITTTLDNILSFNPGIVIITGGLGPTDDDVTLKTLFRFANVSSTFDQKYWNDLKRRFRKSGFLIPESNRNQALIPSSGEVIDNPIGSARGFKFKKAKTTFFSLPGVPSEMMAMMKLSVLPWIKNNNSTKNYIKTLCTTGIPESVLIEEIAVPIKSNHGCAIGYYPSVYGVDIQISSQKKENVTTLFDILSKILNDYVYSENGMKLEEVVIRKAMDLNMTLAVAESCTGGLIGNRITNVSGSSAVFKGSLVTYSNKSKIDILNIDKSCIDKNGAVSRNTAKKMAYNVKEKFSSDIGLSVTGIAGPGGGTEEKPVGLVFIGICSEAGTRVIDRLFKSDRIQNKEKSSQAALNELRLELNKYE